MEYVYLIRMGRHHKIGRSKDPNRRLVAFEGLPEEAVLIHAIHTDEPGELECQLHGRFAEKHIRGEWFNLSPEDVAEICAVKLCDCDSCGSSLPGKRRGIPIYFTPEEKLVVDQAILFAGMNEGRRITQQDWVHDLLLREARKVVAKYQKDNGQQPPPEQPPNRARGKKRRGDKTDG